VEEFIGASNLIRSFVSVEDGVSLFATPAQGFAIINFCNIDFFFVERFQIILFTTPVISRIEIVSLIDFMIFF
jgi:hypothetical protein